MKFLIGLVGAVIVFGLCFFIFGILLKGASDTPNECTSLLVVTKGETIESIAARCNVDTSIIYDLNPGLLRDDVSIQAGMMLRLGGEATIDDAVEAVLPEDQTATSETFNPTPIPQG